MNLECLGEYRGHQASPPERPTDSHGAVDQAPENLSESHMPRELQYLVVHGQTSRGGDPATPGGGTRLLGHLCYPEIPREHVGASLQPEPHPLLADLWDTVATEKFRRRRAPSNASHFRLSFARTCRTIRSERNSARRQMNSRHRMRKLERDR